MCGFAIAAAPISAATKDYVAAERAARGVAQGWLQRLSLRERVAQLVMVPFYGDLPRPRSQAWREYVRWVRELRVGGLILINRIEDGVARNAEPYEMAVFLNRMQRLAPLPLIVAGDFERGASMRVAGTTKFPHLMAFGAAGDLEATRALGRATAQEAHALGVQWIFAPDADVNNNPDNPIINIRSFGEDPGRVAEHVRAFVEGAHAAPGRRVLVTLKHFPGHGDTATDSHLGLARNDADRKRLDAVELAPFRAGIAAGADAVMTAHMAVPALDSPEIPATVSRRILTGLLRDELGFRGIIVTDAMDMQGLARQFSPGEAAVRAIEAGADLLLMPPEPEAAVKAVTEAVVRGRISRRRIDESALRLLTAKVLSGLGRKRFVDVEQIAAGLDSPEAGELARTVAERAVTVLRNEGAAIPLSQPERACYFVLFENRYAVTGRRLAAEVRRRAPKAQVWLWDPGVPQVLVDQAVRDARRASAVVIATFATASAYRGSTELTGNYPLLLERLQKEKETPPVVLVSLGNPYLIRSYPGVAAYMTAFSTAPTSEEAVVKGLFGEIPMVGQTPVSIPGLARIGDGIRVEARLR